MASPGHSQPSWVLPPHLSPVRKVLKMKLGHAAIFCSVGPYSPNRLDVSKPKEEQNPTHSASWVGFANCRGVKDKTAFLEALG